MNERTGVLIAVLSSALGGGAAVATRFMIGNFDPLTLATVRFGGGALQIRNCGRIAKIKQCATDSIFRLPIVAGAFFEKFAEWHERLSIGCPFQILRRQPTNGAM